MQQTSNHVMGIKTIFQYWFQATISVSILLWIVAPLQHPLFGQSDTTTSTSSAGQSTSTSTSPVAQPDVTQTIFIGNTTFSDWLLSQQMTLSPQGWLDRLVESNTFDRHPTYRESLRQIDQEALQRFYRDRGFLDAEVTIEVLQQQSESVWLKVVIREGPVYTVNDWNLTIDTQNQSALTYLQSTPEYRELTQGLTLKPGNIYQRRALWQTQQALSQFLMEQGYFFGTASFTEQLDRDQRRVTLDITLTPGEKTSIDSLAVFGHQSMNRQTLIRDVNLQEGQPIILRDLLEAKESLERHSIVEEARLPMRPLTDSTVVLTLEIEEAPLRKIQTSMGLGTEEYLRGMVQWENRNTNGRGHVLSSMAKASFLEQELNASYFIPYVGSPKNSYSITPFLAHRFGVKRSYEVFQVGVIQALRVDLRRDLRAIISYELSANEGRADAGRGNPKDPSVNYNISAFSLTGTYLPLEPTGQWNGIQTFMEISSPFLLGTYTYQKATIAFRHRRAARWNPEAAWLIKGRLGGLWAPSTPSLPLDLKLYAGGTHTVRGWQRNELGPKESRFNENDEFDRYIPVGGRAMLVGGIERIQPLPGALKRLDWAFFVDGGQVWSDFEAVNLQEIQFGAGFGIGTTTPFGPVRIDVAMKVNPNNQDMGRFQGVDYGSALQRFSLHLQIGDPF
jgi:outer membrane protein insertion porin family